MAVKRADMADHARHYIAVLTAMAAAEEDDTAEATKVAVRITAVRMIREHDRDWLMEHIIFMYRNVFNDTEATITEFDDTWPSYLAGRAADFRRVYEGETA